MISHTLVPYLDNLEARIDPAMNLSPGMVSEFALPYDQRLLDAFGGAVHFCGRGDHYGVIPCLGKHHSF